MNINTKYKESPQKEFDCKVCGTSPITFQGISVHAARPHFPIEGLAVIQSAACPSIKNFINLLLKGEAR